MRNYSRFRGRKRWIGGLFRAARFVSRIPRIARIISLKRKARSYIPRTRKFIRR